MWTDAARQHSTKDLRQEMNKKNAAFVGINRDGAIFVFVLQRNQKDEDKWGVFHSGHLPAPQLWWSDSIFMLSVATVI